MMVGPRAAISVRVAAILAAPAEVEFPPQRDDNVIAAFVGTQLRAEHRGVFLLKQQGGVWT